MEESLKAAAALAVDAKRDAAEIRRDLAEIVRDRKREAAEREAERKRDAAAREAERKERKAESDAWQARHDKAMEEIRTEVGGMANTEGNILEDEVRANLRESLQIGDIRLLKVVPNLHGDYAQYDALGINGKVSVLVEVKRTLRAKDVKTFVEERLANFPDDFPEFLRGRSLIGAMVYQNLRNDAAAKKALEAGLILLRAEGKKGLRQIKTVAAARTPKTKAAASAKKR